MSSRPAIQSLSAAVHDLRLPLLQAPMFLVSSATLASACAGAGLIGAFQLANPRTTGELAGWLAEIGEAESRSRAEGRRWGPICVNVNANAIHAEGYGERFDLCGRGRVPLVLSSIGDPSEVVRRAHDWGGRVIHDVTTLRFAEKAIEAGVDGLMLTCAGAGGHNGALSPFAFLPQVRRMFDGLIVLAGGIADPRGISGALALGADAICMGTRFVATRESAAPDAYKHMLVECGTPDILETDAIAGLTANWLKPSIVANGLDPDNLPRPNPRRRPDLPDGVQAWRNVWSGGHSTGLIDDIPTVAELVDRFETALEGALPEGWQARLAERLRL
jgi:nitronate monooxygenase